METLHTQVTTLSHKVDALYQMIERLSEKFLDCIPESQPKPVVKTETVKVGSPSKPYAAHGYHQYESLLHDPSDELLVDDHSLQPDYQTQDTVWTAEIQIQRLTAQLTAAYNRIAALEEQLLAKRMHVSED